MNTSHALQGAAAEKERFPISLFSLTVGAFAIGITEFVIMGICQCGGDLNVSISQAGQLITGYALGVAFGAPILAMLTHNCRKNAYY